ncbi:protein ANTI-SILENCING 1 isoform X2 [Manihot esculenta]|uniref:protein ANTI-SILENCING 1 isoform X2 n=1 Tax=Manihot esculenta TaxID=3983 RepID=UPI001CC49D0E|nr:protein ANTI-SILENCING 1 isoform X2 [Manihot esculenta]
MVQANEIESIGFKWGKKRGIGGKKKDVQFYESFTYDDVEYALYDSVYIYADGETEPYIGKLIKIWENSDKTKKVKILWFFRPCEISNFLEADKAVENELFLASGEGVGLANVNPLEPIAGKCNVVCISKDSRNPQPSYEEIEMADFIFYRTFDVGHRVITDKIDDKIAGIDVRFLLNSVSIQKPSAVPKPDSNDKEIIGNAVVAGVVDKNVSGKPLKLDDSSTDASTKENSVSRENKAAIMTSVKQKSGLGKKPDSYTNSRSDNEEIAHLKTALVKQKSSLGEKHASKSGVELAEMAKITKWESMSNDKITSRSKDNVSSESKASSIPAIEIHAEKKGKATKDSVRSSDRPSKLANFDDSVKASVNGRNTLQKLNLDSGGSDAKALDRTTTASDDKSKRKLTKNPSWTENISLKKTKLDEKLTKHAIGQLLEASPREASNSVSKTTDQKVEVTRRPEADKSKWFKMPKEAVSTSHCSQPNTIEYDMAMDWCLLQERTDLEWKHLYKQQGQELRKLKANLKSK